MRSSLKTTLDNSFSVFRGEWWLKECSTIFHRVYYRCHVDVVIHFLAFINYNFPYTRFRARKTVLGARPFTWEIVHVKQETYTLLIAT